MPAPKGNQYAKGNKGGYRKGYEWEADQQKQMNRHINWMFAYIEAVKDGRNTPYMDKVYDRFEKIFMKEMDKLHANKNQTDLTTDGEAIQPVLVKFIDEKPNDNRDTGGVQKAV